MAPLIYSILRYCSRQISEVSALAGTPHPSGIELVEFGQYPSSRASRVRGPAQKRERDWEGSRKEPQQAGELLVRPGEGRRAPRPSDPKEPRDPLTVLSRVQEGEDRHTDGGGDPEHGAVGEREWDKTDRDHKRSRFQDEPRRLEVRLATEDDIMKFSHSIQFNAVSDWNNYYVAYRNLKKL